MEEDRDVIGRKPVITKVHAEPRRMADIDVVATYGLFNINRVRLENIIHRVFKPARLDITIHDRFGQPVVPREWFLVPLFVINEAAERIKDGTIREYVYDPKCAQIKRG